MARTRRRLLPCGAILLLLTAALAEAGAGRTRPGGSRSGGSSKVSVGAKASYGHRGHGHHRHRHHHGYVFGHYGHHYGYPYFWPYWGAWYVPARYVVVGSGRHDEAPGTLETDVRPGKAEVRIDGEYVGQARDYNGRWDRLWVAPGDREVEFSRQGYQTLRVQVKVRPGGYVHIAERLVKGEGLDPRSSRRPPPAPPSRPGRPVPDAPSGTAAAEPTFEVGAAGLRRGLLRLEVRPSDAAVYLDGEFLARGDELSRLHGAIPVARGAHSIEVVRPGYRGRTVQVEVDGPEPVRVRIELERGD